MNNYNPVFIVSPPRAGSSLTANIVYSAGLFGGKLKKGDQWNEKGYFENNHIDGMIAEYLRKNDTESKGKMYQPEYLATQSLGFGYKVVESVKAQGLNEGQRWFLKSTKTPLCWRLFNRHFPDAQWVIVERDREAALQSLIRTPFMDAYKTEDDWAKFLDYYDRRFAEIENSCDSYRFPLKGLQDNREETISDLFEYISKGYVSVASSVYKDNLLHG